MSAVVGIIPARMASSRFPGKPLATINGKTMLEHVWAAANEYTGWAGPIRVATCDAEIADFAIRHEWPCGRTGSHHVRALDRVAELAERYDLDGNDIVVCVQGDEPLVQGKEIAQLIDGMGTAGALAIMARPLAAGEHADPNAVKLVTDRGNRMLYSTRAAIPATHRIGGIFAFRWRVLRHFTGMQESPLERAERCDVNRLVDNGIFPTVVKVARAVPSVDVPEDIARVMACLDAGR